MAKRAGKNRGKNRERSQRGELAGDFPQGTSRREASNSSEWEESKTGAAGRYSSVTLTKEELRQITGAFATCLEHSASFPAKCVIVEHARAGMFGLYITVHCPPLKRSVRNSRLGQTASGKP